MEVKYVPTIDYAVYRAFADVYELMLRTTGTGNRVQSLHRFSDHRNVGNPNIPSVVNWNIICRSSFDHRLH